MKNKVYFVKRLCELKELDLESEEAKNLYSLKIVDLLIAIKAASPPSPQTEQEEESEKTLAELLGCS